jgi:phosphate transport system substrate-binding protein
MKVMINKLCRALTGAAAIVFAFAGPTAHAANITLNESGSTLLYPLFQSWIVGYKSVVPDLAITASATGSGAGTKAAIAGSVRIGTSDTYLSDKAAVRNRQIVDIPLAISAQTVNYNLPGLNGTNIRLDGPTLAAIYSGIITEWDDPALKAMNPGVALPHHLIIPVRRDDAAYDTFIFTQFLDFSTETWENNPGCGTEIMWPKVAGEKAAVDNAGVIHTLAATPYAIGYVGISYARQIAKANLGTAMLKNQSGKFLLPTQQSIADAAAQLDPRTPPDERLSLVFAPGDDSYPLINYEYAVVSKSQPNAETARALRSFLLWTISETDGNSKKYLAPVGFISLPDFVRGLNEAQIAEIK